METPVPIPNTEVKRGSGDDTLQWGKQLAAGTKRLTNKKNTAIAYAVFFC